jgi:hypothetical protein
LCWLAFISLFFWWGCSWTPFYFLHPMWILLLTLHLLSLLGPSVFSFSRFSDLASMASPS